MYYLSGGWGAPGNAALQKWSCDVARRVGAQMILQPHTRIRVVRFERYALTWKRGKKNKPAKKEWKCHKVVAFVRVYQFCGKGSLKSCILKFCGLELSILKISFCVFSVNVLRARLFRCMDFVSSIVLSSLAVWRNFPTTVIPTRSKY